MPDSILVAIITGGLGLIGVVWQSRKTRRVNTEEHNMTGTKIDRIELKIDQVDFKTDRIDAKLDDHLDGHP